MVNSPIKGLQRLLGHQRALTKLHFDELHVNESETHGSHFLHNTPDFQREERGGGMLTVMNPHSCANVNKGGFKTQMKAVMAPPLSAAVPPQAPANPGR